METGLPGHSPTPRQARETLQQLAEDESAVRYPPIHRWFILVMAALVVLIYLVQLLPPSDAGNATTALAVVALVLAARSLAVKYWLHRDGVAWVKVKLSDMALYLAASLATFTVCWVVSASTGAWWVWIAGAVVAGGIVVVTGRRYRQEFGDDA